MRRQGQPSPATVDDASEALRRLDFTRGTYPRKHFTVRFGGRRRPLAYPSTSAPRLRGGTPEELFGVAQEIETLNENEK